MKKFIIPAIILLILSLVLINKGSPFSDIAVAAFLLSIVLAIVGIYTGIKKLVLKARDGSKSQTPKEPSRPDQLREAAAVEAEASRSEEVEAVKSKEPAGEPQKLSDEEKEQLRELLRQSVTISVGNSRGNEGERLEKGQSVLVGTLDFTVIDIETTGLSPRTNKIIELGAVRYRDGAVVSQYQQLINPGRSIPKSITKLTGISDDMVCDAPSFENVIDSFFEFIGDDILLGHNTNFDINFIYDACDACGHDPITNDFIDTMRIARKLHPEWPNHKLETLIMELGVEDQGHHRSITDCIMTGECYLRMLTPYPAFFEAIPDAKYYSRRLHQEWNGVVLKDIVPNEDVIVGGTSLTGKTVVFTGSCSVRRCDAVQMAVNAGATVKNTVTMKTDYLVIGKKEIAYLNENGRSEKEEKALALNAEGKADVALISEAEFFDLAQATVSSV